MTRFINQLLRRWLGLEIRQYKTFPAAVTLQPEGGVKGNVLISYIIDPFLVDDENQIPNSHTHHWESWLMAKAFLQMGYAVDVISFMDDRFVPQKNYTLFIAARTNFERIAKLLNSDCIKVAHLDTAHWLYNNAAVLQRSLDLQRRHGVTLASFKFIEYNWAIEHADCATVLGNQFTVDTYAYAQKPVYRIPISSCGSYAWNQERDFAQRRRNYLWFGSKGFVHKGLDLVLEAFAAMPEHHLYVCGPLEDEPQFQQAFHRQLYDTPNIQTIGWVDVDSDEFSEICGKCIGLVYPSCAEGGGGSVIQCMHAGLIPLVSREASVDIHADYGIILEEFSVEEVTRRVAALSSLGAGELEQMSRKAWEFARQNHTREHFFAEFRQRMQKIIDTHRGGRSDVS
jgi:glycosyltransferase involved in cell wall biosynthesis